MESRYKNNIWKTKKLRNNYQVLILTNRCKLFKSIGEKKVKGKWKILHVSASSNPNKNLKTVRNLNILKIMSFQFYLIKTNDDIC